MRHYTCRRDRQAVTFYVQKSLAHGPIRFGVTPRQVLESLDSEPGLSTGPSGEFLRRRTSGFYFADTRPVGAPVLPTSRNISSTPFLSSLKPSDARSWGYVALIVFGLVLVLLGLAVVANKGAQGWVEVILGIAMIATPLILTAQKRRQLQQQEEKERAEREERERREREMLSSYVNAIELLRRDPNPEVLRAVAAEREKLQLPYEIWSPLARRVILEIGFKALDRLKPARSAEVARLMTGAARAAGLSSDDETGVKLDLYRSIVWHLLVDDRHGDAQGKQTFLNAGPLLVKITEPDTGAALAGFVFNVLLIALAAVALIADRDLPIESAAAEEFRKLRGISRDNLPRQDCAIALKFREYCLHGTRGTILSEKGVAQGTYSLYVTNKRLVIDGKQKIEVELPQIDDVEVDIDNNTLLVKIAKPGKPIRIQAEQPIYTAALIDLATTIDERPKGFA